MPELKKEQRAAGGWVGGDREGLPPIPPAWQELADAAKTRPPPDQSRYGHSQDSPRIGKAKK